ncbi:HD domain-containing protein [Peribacillus psychrosaccharolyticus]|nr:HD domain-containing protein [Peribacillus psychrosaccharolyticus]
MLQTVYKDKLFYLYPSENPDVMEFIYILSGEIECEQDGQITILGANDYCSVKGLKQPVYFLANTDVTYLWIITEPTFQQISTDRTRLQSMIRKVEEKDPYTFRHSERVTFYAIKIAKKLNLKSERLQDLYIASELHDIGKMKTPIDILNKPGKLTKEEFNIIKKHPGDGADLVLDTTYNYLAPIIEQHHERLNGSGYPHGLKEHEILLEAKIIAVTDTYDAMTEDRSYRKAFTPQYAMEEIKRMSGTHYDPEIVDALEIILKEEGIL